MPVTGLRGTVTRHAEVALTHVVKRDISQFLTATSTEQPGYQKTRENPDEYSAFSQSALVSD
jgi:hypothetical protein